MSIFTQVNKHTNITKITNRFAHWRAELENLYVGWVHNPIIDLWNGFVHFHNDRLEAQYGPVPDDEESIAVKLDGKATTIRPLWFAEDFGKVLKQAMRSQKRTAKNQNRKNSPSKRRKDRFGGLGHKNR